MLIMGTVNEILDAFVKLSLEERKRLVDKMQEISLLDRAKQAKQNLIQGKVQRGSASDLIDAMNND